MISEKQLDLLSDLLKVYVDMAIQNVREKQQKPAGFPSGRVHIEEAGEINREAFEQVQRRYTEVPKDYRGHGNDWVAPNDFDKKVEVKLKDDIPTHLIDALKYSHLNLAHRFRNVLTPNLTRLQYKGF